MILVNVVAVSIIIAWAFWCILVRRVSDGIIGKILYTLLMLAALGVLSNPGQNSETFMNATFAAIGLRHFWMKTFWHSIKSHFVKRIRCETCPRNQEP